jgi:peptide-methionine (S)-S-oxide reductase
VTGIAPRDVTPDAIPLVDTCAGAGAPIRETGMARLKAFSLLIVAASLAMAQAASAQPAQAQPAKATFAGGCFWCVEADFDKVNGVISTTSGYIGGKTAKPSYEQVITGNTGHAEAVEIAYDPSKVTYEQLLDVFWRNVDPFVRDRQFCDSGNQYRTAIFVHGDEQRRLAEASKKAVETRFKRPVATQIVNAGAFYPAEDYHQDFYRKNPSRYNFYRWNCGRDQRLEQIWGKK